MANTVMPKWKAAQQLALTPDLSSGAVNVKAVYVDTSLYTFSVAHEFLSDVAAGARVATSGNLASKTVAAADGTFDAADLVVSAVTGASIETCYLYHDTGVEATSRLIVYLDTGVTGLPLTPNGTDLTITWSASGIFKP